jgi:hypothetical protein
MVADFLYFNGVDATTAYGFQASALPEIYSAPVTPWEAITIPQRPGVLLRRDTPEVQSRVLDITGIIIGTNAADAVSKLELMKRDLLGRPILVAFGAVAGLTNAREYSGVVESLSGNLFSGGQITNVVTARLLVLVPDGAARDAVETIDSESPAAPITIAVGTAPTFARVTIIGPATDPVLTYTDGFAQTMGTMDFDVTLATGDSLVIDGADGGSVTHVVGGVSSQGLGLITNADYLFPVFTPADVDPAGPTMPNVTASSGATLTARYRRRYY